MYDEWPDERWTTTRSARNDYDQWVAAEAREAADAEMDAPPDDETPECPVYDDTIPF